MLHRYTRDYDRCCVLVKLPIGRGLLARSKAICLCKAGTEVSSSRSTLNSKASAPLRSSGSEETASSIEGNVKDTKCDLGNEYMISNLKLNTN